MLFGRFVTNRGRTSIYSQPQSASAQSTWYCYWSHKDVLKITGGENSL